MRVLLAPDRFGALTSVEAAAALRAGWAQSAPGVDCVELPQSTGGWGFLRAIEAVTQGDLHLLDVGDELSVPAVTVPKDTLTTYVEAAEVLDNATSSAPLGRLLDRVNATDVPRVVIGLGDVSVLDGGRGLVQALGAGPAEARARLQGMEIVVAADTDRVLLGLQGACASAPSELGLSQEEAQTAERHMGEWVDEVRRALPPPVDLLSGQPQRTDRLPGAGAGGGIGFALAALGAHIRSGPEVVAEVSGLAAAARGSAVVVTAVTSYDWTVLHHSVAEEVASAAASNAAPAVLLADDIQVGRRETMSLGFASSYGVLRPGRMRARGETRTASQDEAALQALAARIATTWTPARG
ncbi:glycerate kinase [Demetria terragena]|uniref:glycerate kinase n=1 Tax=Demetria terragena TaxID=63959 RepID=UPI00037DD293|nr:glycerate kinase [Demetria terragena]